ncbi:hypothetical protein WJ28_06175, partial [Burkholderia thailandensis]|uniref:hypothetical protein n=1 Tax=Burkholderia thailandensis TaxID=57975 RepID=UPI00075CB859
ATGGENHAEPGWPKPQLSGREDSNGGVFTLVVSSAAGRWDSGKQIGRVFAVREVAATMYREARLRAVIFVAAPGPRIYVA